MPQCAPPSNIIVIIQGISGGGCGVVCDGVASSALNAWSSASASAFQDWGQEDEDRAEQIHNNAALRCLSVQIIIIINSSSS